MSVTNDEHLKRITRWYYKDMWGGEYEPSTENFASLGKLLMHVAGADGELVDAERDWIIGYYSAMGAPPHIIESLKNYDPSSEDITAVLKQAAQKSKSKASIEKNTRRLLIFDGFRAASADKELHRKEKQAIYALAQKIGVDYDSVKAIEKLFKANLKWRQKGASVLTPDGIIPDFRR
ncbi:unnamed protein product [Didymodactylos carnosus]|uniref:Co-chaperone DjlA N-terminal domain-containing protein n=1 Tax=Didymodactylos carnosus TaxID=1234261 RepID=A0A814MAK7_9BILA|nr:unnamed protein product [Didymodactylos carnosus]CAF3840790.1 unnamed protein product [Didymodactylos carnosus]